MMKILKYKGREIKIDEKSTRLEVFIDGKKMTVIKKKDGYSIAYNQEQTIEKTIKAFIDTQS